MSCHKCIYAINWGRPFSNKDSTHATCGFTCINFDISGKYQDDFGPIIKSNAVDLMLQPTDGNINQVLTRIRSKFKQTAGDSISGYYSIEGTRNEPYKISLNRELVKVIEK